LGSEYGMKPDDVRKLTRREIVALIDGLVSRKSGYQNSEETVNIEPTDEVMQKIERLNKRRFGEKNG